MKTNTEKNKAKYDSEVKYQDKSKELVQAES